MSINLTGTGLTVEKVVQVARGREPVSLDPEARTRIVKCRALLEDKIQKKEIMYGVNTGIGELANVVLTQEQVEEYQRYIIYSHAAGYGKPLPEDIVLAAILRRRRRPRRPGRRCTAPRATPRRARAVQLHHERPGDPARRRMCQTPLR